MSEMKLSWDLGMDQISSESNLPDGAVLDATNVDIDRGGNVSRRDGATLLVAGVAHSVWSSVDGGRSFVVINGVLKSVVYSGGSATLTTVRSLGLNRPLSYDTLNDTTVACNHAELFSVDSYDSSRLLGLEVPGTTAAAVADIGGLAAGRYAVATSYIKGSESTTSFADIGETVPLDQQSPNDNGYNVAARKITVAAGRTVNSLSIYAQTGAGNVRLAIYDANGAGGIPLNLVAQTASVAASTGWNKLPTTTNPVLAGGSYWLCYQTTSGSFVNMQHHNASGDSVYYAASYGPFDSTFNQSPTVDNVYYSLFGEFSVTTAGGNGEEGALSAAAFVDVPEGGGITVNLTQPNEGLPTGIRIYRTTTNGEILLRAADVGLGLSTWLLGNATLGRAADTQFKGRMFGGDIVRYWRGRLWVAKGTRIYLSDPLRYGMYDPREGFLQLPRRVTMMRPVEGGVFVGTSDGVKFYSGTGPTDMTIKDTGGTAPVEGTDTLVSAEEFGDIGIKGKFVALWLAANGFIVGQPDGSLISKQSDRIRLPSGATGTGAVVVNARQAVAVVA